MSSGIVRQRPWQVFLLVVVMALALTAGVFLSAANAAPVNIVENPTDGPQEADTQRDTVTSHRLIVQLESPPAVSVAAAIDGGEFAANSPAAQAHIAQLQAEQNAFVNAMNEALPSASVATYLNERGQEVRAAYQLTFNGLAIDPGEVEPEVARRELMRVSGVKAVFHDYAYWPDLYSSLDLINAPALWDEADIGGRANAGAGVKVASIDCGLHHEAPMFDGADFEYPDGYPLGYTENTNGKIIVSRVYFRTWDPPAADDATPWPGASGCSHGVHTGSIAVGNTITDATYLGADVPTISGVAPGAWAMSYKVFYNSVTGDGSFYTVEGLAAIEDAVRDGADVINNSWGGGPGSIGGDADPIDAALINAVRAGVFVSMSAGNAGPGLGTGDHPSEEYINVAASTTDGTYASGLLSVSAPTPVPDELQDMPFGTADFGPPLPVATTINYPFVPAADVDPGNVEGCTSFPADVFEDSAALISRGTCSFGDKVFYAQEAGAEFVVVYNNDGDGILNMGFSCTYAPDCGPGDITISSIFIGQTNGEDMVDWYDTHETDAELEVDTVAFQAGNQPDVIANFSSRGPSTGATLKPDIAAPGVNIMAQGYDGAVTGEDQHLGYGQVSGTSMAAPHVAGAAAVILQAHPDWSPQQVKSAMMTTSKYLDIFNQDGSPAQPLDMGAGRLDLANVTAPGVFLEPVNVGFGYVISGTAHTMEVMVTSAADTTETYDLSTLYTGGGFGSTTTLPGFSVSPTSITLAPGDSAPIEVTFDTTEGQGIGENQGYVILESDNYEAHFPVWARVMPEPESTADVLLIDNDGSTTVGFPDYSWYYTSTLDNLGIDYHYLDADANANNPTTIPEPAELASYDAIVYFTGDNFYPDGTFTVATPLTPLDMDRLVEYANQGGVIIAMGQDATWVLNDSFFQGYVLGAERLQDSITGFQLPDQPVVPFAGAPPAFDGLSVDLSGPNQVVVPLEGANEVPPVDSPAEGTAHVSYNVVDQILSYQITVNTTELITLTAAHVHTGTVGVNGPVIHPTFPFTAPVPITDTISWSGAATFSDDEEAALFAGNLYINVHSEDNPGGEIRGQIYMDETSGDGAGNQLFIDELENQDPAPDPVPGKPDAFLEVLRYPGPGADQDGTVSIAHRNQPSLEYEEVEYLGRSIFASFGLEGVNNGVGATSREELMQHFLDWAFDEPEVEIGVVDYPDEAVTAVFSATVSSNITDTSGVSFRWDFGDGTGYFGPYESSTASHDYEFCGTFDVRVEATDSWGNVAIGHEQVTVSEDCQFRQLLPIILNNTSMGPPPTPSPLP
ncbi:MAG: S8 family serine peptidase [Chloroflexota bacterium]